MYHNRLPGRAIAADSSYARQAAAETGVTPGGNSVRLSGESTRNPLGQLIEHRFGEPSSPCRSYSELERRSGVSREALSRYITSRPDRRRSPTVETLAAIAG